MLRLIRQVEHKRMSNLLKKDICIKMKELDEKRVSWRVQEEKSQDEKQFEMGKTSTFMELEEKLMDSLSSIKDITFIDYDNTQIASTNQLQQIGYEFKIHLQTLDHSIEKVSIEDESEQRKDDYSQLRDFCDNIDLPLLQKNVIMGYLKKVDLVLQNKHGLKAFDDLADPEGVAVTKDSLSLSLLEGLITRTGINKTSETLLFKQYLDVQQQFQSQQNAYNDLDRRAHRNTKAKLSLGLFALIGQFYFVGYGTYVAYSWDIMEPIVYFINLSFTILFSYQFFRLKDEFSPQTFYLYLKNKEIIRLANQQTFQLDTYYQLQKQLEDLDDKIKMNVIGTL